MSIAATSSSAGLIVVRSSESSTEAPQMRSPARVTAAPNRRERVAALRARLEIDGRDAALAFDHHNHLFVLVTELDRSRAVNLRARRLLWTRLRSWGPGVTARHWQGLRDWQRGELTWRCGEMVWARVLENEIARGACAPHARRAAALVALHAEGEAPP